VKLIQTNAKYAEAYRKLKAGKTVSQN
jgi:hypothetical protein